MPKKGKKNKRKGNQKTYKKEEDDFDPLANVVIDKEFLPMSQKKGKKQGKPKPEKKNVVEPVASTGPLSGLKSKAKLYKISDGSIAKLIDEGFEDDDLEGLELDDIKETGISEDQAEQIMKAIRGDPVEEQKDPLAKLKASMEQYGITGESVTVLESEELADDDLEDLSAEDLVEMDLTEDQAARIVAAVKGDPVPTSEPQKLALLRAKAKEFKINDAAIDALAKEDLDDEDLYDLDKSDLKSMGIVLGQVLRILKAVKAIKAEAPKEAKSIPETKKPVKEEKTKVLEKKDIEKKEPTSKVEEKKEPQSESDSQAKPSKQNEKPTGKKDNDDPFADFLGSKTDTGGEENLTKAQLKRRRKAQAKAAAASGGEKKDDGQVTDPSKMSKKQLKKWKQKQKKLEEQRKREEALKKFKEEQERRRKEEEERIRLEKERIEREKREAEAERKRQEEEKERKRLEKIALRKKLKREGKILTKKQRAQRAQNEKARARLLAAQGGDGQTAQQPSRRRDDRRDRRRGNKQKSKKQLAMEEARKRAEEAAKKEAEEARLTAEKKKAEEAASAKKADNEEDDEGDAWDAEDVEDTWDIDSDEERKREEVKKRKEEEERKKAEELRKAEEERKRKEEEAERKRQKEEAEKAAKKAAEEKAAAEKKARTKGKKSESISKKRKKDKRELRSPICCILGHVDTGKTKLLDKMRSTNVQDREAGGITQQIGATYFPMSNIEKATNALVEMIKKPLNAKIPGLLMIDTPGHESFTNLRARGSNLCDIAILVVDIMHSLEPQTEESIRLLKERGTPFVVALNKVDRLFEWKSTKDGPVRESLKNQAAHVKQEFKTRTNQVIAEFAQKAELNTTLYWKNKNYKEWISLVPTSAHTGEGIPDLLWLLVKMTQTFMRDKITVSYSDLQCTILEVKKVEGLGTTIDVVLVNGILKEGDTIVVCGLSGPIVTTIRALLTPPPMKEIRVKTEYVHHKEIKAAMGVKITANGLENAIAGTQLFVCGQDDDIEDLKDDVMADFASILSKIHSSGQGVYVQASTLGSLEALLQFLEDQKVPVSGIAIGPVRKKDVIKAAVMKEQNKEEYAVILAFDVPVSAEGKQIAAEMGVTIFTADIIYHLFDMVTKYFKDIRDKRRQEAAPKAVFPCVLKILPEFIFNKRSPIVIGVEVVEGILRTGTPLCVTEKNPILDIGNVTSIEFEHKEVKEAKKGEQVCIKIEQQRGNQIILLGRHFDLNHELKSKLTRESIKLLKENFKEDLEMDDWKLVVKLKRVFNIIGKST
mmetsp:Transcript_553/g.735  ORF Transcript_553/g.735 Transcript_553/m.735 type:complete len:1277 (-) Transcript_553:100-3930(-)